MSGIAGIGLRAGLHLALQRFIAHHHFARLPVQFIKHCACSIRLRVADGQQLDDERFARLQLNRDLFAALETVEELRRRQHIERPPRRPRFRELEEHLRVHQIAHQIRG